MSGFFKLLPVLLLVLVGMSSVADARNAGLLLSPTRIVLEDGKRYTTMIVRNDGDATGSYKIDVVDTTMDENGVIKVLDEGVKDQYSAKDMISLSPRVITLKPDESQSVRILIKHIPDIADGEYRSHFSVKMTDNGFDPNDLKKNPNGATFGVQTRLTTVIPVIIRIGKTNYELSIDDAKLVTGGGDNKKSEELKVSMTYSGNRSAVGDIKVVHLAADGKETQLSFFRGVAIYRTLTKRYQTVPLEVPAGLDIHTGKIRVDFLTQEAEGSHVISEKVITP